MFDGKIISTISFKGRHLLLQIKWQINFNMRVSYWPVLKNEMV